MKRALFLPLIFVMLVSLACSFGSQPKAPTAEAPEPVQDAEPPVTVDVEPEPVEGPEVSVATGEGAVANLQDAEHAVVRIVVQGSYEYAGYGSFEQEMSGSGFIIDPSGLAVTNNHVVTGAAMIEVYFSGDSKPKQAKLIGYSECADLALIDIEGDGYPYFNWYSEDIERGLAVYSLGYPLGDPEFTQHQGTISKKSADFPTNWASVSSAVEHDAIINQGNSGGPLITAEGEVVGVNYIVSTTYDQYYAISYEEAQPVIEQLQAGENVHALGINGEAFVTEDGSLSGIWVYSVASGSPADQTGVKPGDILLEMEGIALGKDGTMGEYCGILRGHSSDDTLSITVLRANTGEVLEGQFNGRELEVTGTLDTTTTGEETTTAGGDYFTDEFDGDITAYTQWVTAGNKSKDFAERFEGRLKFELPSAETYSYVQNESYVYSDVYVEAEVQAIEGGRNGMAVMCRISDEGWYEFRISTRGQYAGSYEVYRYDYSVISQHRNPYINLIKSDRIWSTDIVTGFKPNTIGMWCSGDTLRLFINGKEQTKHGKEIIDSELKEGYVGVGAMSFSDGPIRIEYEWLATSE